MKKYYSFSQIYLLLFSMVLITACNSHNKSTSPENTGTETEAILIHSAPLEYEPPRVDSVLQFNSMITSMLEDSKGIFWFGSHGNGLCRYDPTINGNGGKQFTYFTVKQGLPTVRFHEDHYRRVPMGDLIRAIKEDKSENILISSADGFSKFNPGVKDSDGAGNYFTPIDPEEKRVLITESFDFSKNDSDEEWKKNFNQVWFGDTQNNGAYRYDGYKLTHFIFPTPKLNFNGTSSQYATYSLYKDRDENIWFGTESGGIMRYNHRSFTCINEKEEKGIVRSFFQDKSGKVWISNVLKGLYYYDHSTPTAGRESLINFTHEKGYYSLNDVRNNTSLDKSKMLDGIQTMEQDAEGHLWFGTYSDGLWHYDPDASENELTHYTEENGFPSNTVKTIYKDKRGKLWFGIGNEKAFVYHFNGTSFERFGGSSKF